VPSFDPELDQLTPRERQVLRLIARGYAYKEVAVALSISVKTVESHVSAVYASSSCRAATSSPLGFGAAPVLTVDLTAEETWRRSDCYRAQRAQRQEVRAGDPVETTDTETQSDSAVSPPHPGHQVTRWPGARSARVGGSGALTAAAGGW